MSPELFNASPLVVVGMHRSGTRLLVDLLDRLGVFMGADRQADAESVTFMLINETILHQCGAFWSEPMSAHFLLSQPQSAASLAAMTREAFVAGYETYRGESHTEPHPVGASATGPFGWKDPRNTFTLPVWRRVFPQLRVLNIVRHGVDVAASLSRRHAAALRAATGDGGPSALTVIRDQAFGVLSSRRGWTLAEALTMWEQYVEKARLESAELGDRALEIRYEALLTEPATLIGKIARFCGVAAPEDLSRVVDGFDAGRAFAFRRDRQLTTFAESVRDVLARYDYAP